MAAACGVPLGGALFALEVLRGELTLRFVLPALLLLRPFATLLCLGSGTPGGLFTPSLALGALLGGLLGMPSA